MKTSLGSFFLFLAKLFMRCAYWHPARRPHAFFTRNPFRPTYFLPTAAKSKQKVPLEGNALYPIILRIKQGSIGFLRSTASPS
ncbi:MAG: hypothetical protein ACJASR_002038 [Psychroserpens sp.]|jgi:hypothetical protein